MNAIVHRWLRALLRAYRPAAQRGMLTEGAWPWPVASRPRVGAPRAAAASPRQARPQAAARRTERPAA